MSHQVRGSREQVHNDVELELQEAMAENVFGEESLLDGEARLVTFAFAVSRLLIDWRKFEKQFLKRMKIREFLNQM